MLTRRACIVGGAAAVTLAPELVLSADDDQAFDPQSALPHKSAFATFGNTAYLNCASQHPLSLAGRRAVNAYLDYKSFDGRSDYSNFEVYERVLEKYARLINADKDEVCYVQSTTVGENLVLKALELDNGSGRIVTDDLHYVGSLPTYAELQRSGVEIVTLRADSSGRVTLDQYEAAITAGTTLVCLSSVSMVNGYHQDLAGLCEIAHDNGALVYADVVHEVGSMPFDVRASGVDFCSAASYKWLMGEQGLGFLYARKDRLAALSRPWYGHYQLKSRSSLGFPNPGDGQPNVTEYEHLDSAVGYFAMGSQANINAALLDQSLQYLLDVGPDRIQKYRQPLIDRLQHMLPRLGYQPITPTASKSALVSFLHDGNTAQLRQKLSEAGITATVAQRYLRVSPSVFNDRDDIERLIAALT